MQKLRWWPCEKTDKTVLQNTRQTVVLLTVNKEKITPNAHFGATTKYIRFTLLQLTKKREREHKNLNRNTQLLLVWECRFIHAHKYENILSILSRSLSFFLSLSHNTYFRFSVDNILFDFIP